MSSESRLKLNSTACDALATLFWAITKKSNNNVSFFMSLKTVFLVVFLINNLVLCAKLIRLLLSVVSCLLHSNSFSFFLQTLLALSLIFFIWLIWSLSKKKCWGISYLFSMYELIFAFVRLKLIFRYLSERCFQVRLLALAEVTDANKIKNLRFLNLKRKKFTVNVKLMSLFDLSCNKRGT